MAATTPENTDANDTSETMYEAVSNPSHILFLHPSDNPNNILVNELLNDKNYGTWKKSMKIALIAKNKLGFVLGTCGQPGSTSRLFSQWDRCDKMVIS